LRERRAFRLPPGRAWPRWWLVASVLAHFAVLTALVESTMSWHRERARGGFLLLGALPPGQSTRQIVLYVPSAPVGHGRGPGVGESPGRAAGVSAAVIPTPVAPPVDSGTPTLRIGAGGRDTVSVAMRGSRWGRGVRGVTNYTPQLGDGRVWVDPVTGRLTAPREIRLDSAVAMRMQELADSMEKNPLPDANADPYVSKPWTFRVGGKTYGIDAKGIHLGDITIPTAVLAFLSTPQGNIDQARANQAYMAMRADILRAAARAQTMDDFRQAVKEIRARKEKEHEEQQQRQQANPQPVQP
jgi:hypothetical protein